MGKNNPNYDNIILGSGIAGLIIFYYLAEDAKTTNIILTNDIGGQISSKFPLGPRYLHYNKDTEILLKRLGFDVKTKEIFIGYKTGSEIRNYPTEEFKELYCIKSRNTKNIESSFLSGGGKSNFTAFTTSQTALGKSLVNRCLKIAEKSKNNSISIENVINISFKKINTDKNIYYSNNIISTIPLNSLLKIMSNSSMSINISAKPESISFFLVDDREKSPFDYIYSVSDIWHRKTYIPELKKWVYETRNEKEFEKECKYDIIDKKTLNTQITNSLNLKEIANIKLVGRYAQMNHSIKTEDVIKWAYNYTRKFKKN